MCDSNQIHPLEGNLGLICFILNILFMPLGTWVHALMGPNPGRGIIIGVLQCLTLPLFLIGWIWAIVYGYRIYQRSVNHYLNNQGGYKNVGPN